jgi:hypothetical protein
VRRLALNVVPLLPCLGVLPRGDRGSVVGLKRDARHRRAVGDWVVQSEPRLVGLERLRRALRLQPGGVGWIRAKVKLKAPGGANEPAEPIVIRNLKYWALSATTASS